MFDAAAHRDFLGACLATGIERRTIGDVLVQRDTGAQILCTTEIADFVTLGLTQVLLLNLRQLLNLRFAGAGCYLPPQGAVAFDVGCRVLYFER